MIDTSVFVNKKVKFHTLGCKLNFSESSAIGARLAEAGFRTAGKNDKSDLVVINTCSVTELADKKCRSAIRSEIQKNPGAYVVVTGCYAQLRPEDISNISGVDMVLGANEKFRILDFIDHMEKQDNAEIHVSKLKDIKAFYPSFSGSDRTRCFLKVQDGCDYFCSYCTIPFARGVSRSGTVNETFEKVLEAIADGAKEIILTGVNIGDFGKASGESFYDLLKRINNISSEVRFRISSIEPNLLTNEIIELVASSKRITPHFHLPLQSGSEEVLRLMKRRYSTVHFVDRINTIRMLMPDAFIGVDVIVGVNGETDTCFEEALTFVKALDVSQLHVFTYSERAGTQALKISPKVSHIEKKQRSSRFHQLSDEKILAFYLKQDQRENTVLFEKQKSGGNMFGFTDNYIKICHPYNEKLVNQFTKIKTDGYSKTDEAMMCKLI